MTPMHLPLPPDEMAAALSGVILLPTTSGAPVTITVSDVEVRPTAAEALLFAANLTVTAADRTTEEWSWHLELTDVELDMPAQTLVRTIRANLEEWWHVKDVEPEFANWGRRLR